MKTLNSVNNELKIAFVVALIHEEVMVISDSDLNNMYLSSTYKLYRVDTTFCIVFENLVFRYFLRVSVIRRISDISKELDLAVHTLSSFPEMNNRYFLLHCYMYVILFANSVTYHIISYSLHFVSKCEVSKKPLTWPH